MKRTEKEEERKEVGERNGMEGEGKGRKRLLSELGKLFK